MRNYYVNKIVKSIKKIQLKKPSQLGGMYFKYSPECFISKYFTYLKREEFKLIINHS